MANVCVGHSSSCNPRPRWGASVTLARCRLTAVDPGTGGELGAPPVQRSVHF